MRWLFVCAWTVVLSSNTFAQGLLWQLPEDGAWIRYEGDYTQTITRPNEAPQVLSWTRYVTIRSVGKEDGDYRGMTQPCRWVEIEVETGDASGGVLDAGPGGQRMFKLLIPESAIRGTVREPVAKGKDIFASYIPIVKGFRKIGDNVAEPIPSGIFQIYPVVSLLQHYENLQADGDAQPLTLAKVSVNAQAYKGSLTTERNNYRSTNTGEVFRCEELPFGVAKWTATTVVEEKATTDPRSQFEETVSIKEVMQAAEVGTDAESELIVE
ncbi:MAG: hypothetical protein KDA69_16045 [Planctomycetaceae bacterium]|nr:hypothetical protein [Planctomycetaceae bacterium]MCA9045840.1 hypothetical protein [Planctomycetaceae bacterium]